MPTRGEALAQAGHRRVHGLEALGERVVQRVARGGDGGVEGALRLREEALHLVDEGLLGLGEVALGHAEVALVLAEEVVHGVHEGRQGARVAQALLGYALNRVGQGVLLVRVGERVDVHLAVLAAGQGAGGEPELEAQALRLLGDDLGLLTAGVTRHLTGVRQVEPEAADCDWVTTVIEIDYGAIAFGCGLRPGGPRVIRVRSGDSPGRGGRQARICDVLDHGFRLPWGFPEASCFLTTTSTGEGGS